MDESDRVIEEFVRTLIAEVRDKTVRETDGRFRGTSALAEAWRQDVNGRISVPETVDATIFYLLEAIDKGLLKLRYTDSRGDEIDLTSDGRGELAGLFLASDLWRAEFCRERFLDPATTEPIFPRSGGMSMTREGSAGRLLFGWPWGQPSLSRGGPGAYPQYADAYPGDAPTPVMSVHQGLWGA